LPSLAGLIATGGRLNAFRPIAEPDTVVISDATRPLVEDSFELSPLDDGRATLIHAHGEYDAMSLGWLVKFFLKHHPEILHGVFPGTVLVLLDAMRRAAESPT